MVLTDFPTKLVDICVVDGMLYAALDDTTVRKYDIHLYAAPALFRSIFNLPKLQAIMETDTQEDHPFSPHNSLANQKLLLKFYCNFGLTEPAKYLIRKCSLTLNDPEIDDAYEESALYFAIKNQQWRLLKELRIDQGISQQVTVTVLDKKIIELLQRKARYDDVDFFRGFAGKGDRVRYPQVEVLSASFLRKDSELRCLKHWLEQANIEDINIR
jgi:hypothetical protein